MAERPFVRVWNAVHIAATPPQRNEKLPEGVLPGPVSINSGLPCTPPGSHPSGHLDLENPRHGFDSARNLR